ncbi:MAG: hypothetical protein VCA55_07695 [Verrucomicrobiales bacterium]
MSLKKFHILFISLATLCFIGSGVWCFMSAAKAAHGLLFAGIASSVLGLATAVYGLWFYRSKIRNPDEGSIVSNQS